jgi:hypothetical protein
MPQFVVKDSGVREEYASGMRRDTQEGKPDYTLIDISFLTRLAEHLGKGAIKYGENNWRLANSEEELRRFHKSAMRHHMQWENGETDEDHAMAIVFNIMCAEYVKLRLETEIEEFARLMTEQIKDEEETKVKCYTIFWKSGTVSILSALELDYLNPKIKEEIICYIPGAPPRYSFKDEDNDANQTSTLR